MQKHDRRVLLRRLAGVFVLIALAGGALQATTAGATAPSPITDLEVAIEGDQVELHWTGGAIHGTDDPALTVAEVRVAHPWLAPRLGEWFTIQDQTLDPATNTITLPNFKTVWTVTMAVRVRQYYVGGDPHADATESPTIVMYAPPAVGPDGSPRYEVTGQETLGNDATITDVGFPSAGWGAVENLDGPPSYDFVTSHWDGTEVGQRFAGDVADPLQSATPVTLGQPQRLDDDSQLKYRDAVSSSVAYDPGDPEADPPVPPRYFMAYIANRTVKPVVLSEPAEGEDPNCSLPFQAIGIAYSDDGSSFKDLDIVVTSPTEDEILAPDGTIMLPGWDEDPQPDPTEGIGSCQELSDLYGDLMAGHNYAGTASLLVRDDDAYLYFLQDTNHPVSVGVVGDVEDAAANEINDHHTKVTSHRPAVAKAPLEALRAAAATEDTDAEDDDYTNAAGDLFVKFSAGPDTWDEDGIGGDTAPIVAVGMEGQNGMDVIASACEVYLVTTTYDFQSIIAGHRSTGSSVLIGSSTTGTAFEMESLNVDYMGGGVPFPDLVTTAAFVSGEAHPKLDEDGSFHLFAFRRPVPRESLMMEGQRDLWEFDRFDIQDNSAAC